MPSLSAVLITRDEEADIGRTLDAVGFADEVLVVDSGSTDRTVEICRARGARVLEHAFEGYGPQKRWAVEQARHDWVLCVDADEVPDPELVRAIRALLAGAPPVAAYRLTFHTVFMGRALSRGLAARRGHVRLFDRRRARWSEARVHERVEVDGPVGSLPGAVLHHNARDLSEAVTKLDRYSRMGAEELLARGRRPRGAPALLALAPYHFLRHWLVDGEVLNGIPGFAWAFMLTANSVLKHLRARELHDHEPRPARGGGTQRSWGEGAALRRGAAARSREAASTARDVTRGEAADRCGAPWGAQGPAQQGWGPDGSAGGAGRHAP